MMEVVLAVGWLRWEEANIYGQIYDGYYGRN